MARWVLHVDLDQFIAAVEVLRHPELRGRPVVVGGDGDPTKRGVVSTASYEAREHGVHSGLPLRTAAKRLPDAVFLPVDRAAYEEISETVMEVLRSTGAVVEVLGWDEAFVGVDTEDPEAFAPVAGAPGQGGHATGLHGGDRREQAAGQDRHRVRQAGRGVPADVRELVRGARGPADRGAVGHRRQDGEEARRSGHRHGQRPGRRRPGRAGRGVRADDRAVAGAAGLRPGRRRGGRLALCGARPRARGDVPAEHRRLVAGGGRSGADRRAAGR